MKDMVANSLDVVFAWDGKFWRSIAALITAPGKLTKDYLDGKIVRYIHPSKLFWFLSIVLFALLVNSAKTDEFRDEVSRQQSAMVEQSVAMVEQSVAMGEKLFAWAPYLMLVLAPIFALLVRLFYRRRGMFYADYLIFALHFHAFVFLLYSLTSGVELLFPQLIGNETYKNVIGSVGTLVPWIYLVASLRRVFGAKIVPAIFKTMSITFLYALAMLVVIVFVAGVSKGLGL